MIDCDLAEMYQVENRVINQAVKRIIDRFPKKFRFQLSLDEVEDLKSQIVNAFAEMRIFLATSAGYFKAWMDWNANNWNPTNERRNCFISLG